MARASEKDKAQMRTRYQRLKASGLCPQCGKRKPSKGKTTCEICAEKRREWHRNNRQRSNELAARRRQRLWDTILRAYGPYCACCGEDHKEFLTIDHVNGGGRAHRKELGNNSRVVLLKWIVDNDFPDSIRILCMNCNLSYGAYGYCPHQKEKNSG